MGSYKLDEEGLQPGKEGEGQELNNKPPNLPDAALSRPRSSKGSTTIRPFISSSTARKLYIANGFTAPPPLLIHSPLPPFPPAARRRSLSLAAARGLAQSLDDLALPNL